VNRTASGYNRFTENGCLQTQRKQADTPVFILFPGGRDLLPFEIDSAEPGSLSVALLVNMGLIILLGLQHSMMARPGFKDAVIKAIPPALDRPEKRPILTQVS
jgi:hypothetical protein